LQPIALSQMDTYRKELLRHSRDRVDEVMFNKVSTTSGRMEWQGLPVGMGRGGEGGGRGGAGHSGDLLDALLSDKVSTEFCRKK